MSQARVKPGKIKKDDEKSILISSIVSTNFLKQTEHFLYVDSFQIPYARKIFKWVKDYYNKYDEAPNKNISDIFESEKRWIDETDAELIEGFLSSISNQYIKEKDNFNASYSVDKAKQYVKEQELKQKIKEVNGLLLNGRVDEAESVLVGYKRKAVEVSSWENPLDLNYIRSHFQTKDQNILFTMPGDFGKMIGPLERGRMIAIQAPLKTGKSWALGLFRNSALINRLKVAEFNLEMLSSSVTARAYKSITAAAVSEGESLFPVVDCVLNQTQECKKPEKKNNIALCSHPDHMPEWGEHKLEYKVCDVCRGTDDFVPSTWYESIEREELTESLTTRKVKAFHNMWGSNNWRLKVYNKFSATVDDMKRDLDFLEDTENWVPDVLVIDYPALFRSKNSREDRRIQISDIWKEIGGIATEKKCLVVAAVQTNREGSKKGKSSIYDVSESITIAQDIDIGVVLNQSEQQKKRGVISASIGAMRDGEYHKADSCLILQDLKAGQAMLDSYFQEG